MSQHKTCEMVCNGKNLHTILNLHINAGDEWKSTDFYCPKIHLTSDFAVLPERF